MSPLHHSAPHFPSFSVAGSPLRFLLLFSSVTAILSVYCSKKYKYMYSLYHSLFCAKVSKPILKGKSEIKVGYIYINKSDKQNSSNFYNKITPLNKILGRYHTFYLITCIPMVNCMLPCIMNSKNSLTSTLCRKNIFHPYFLHFS